MDKWKNIILSARISYKVLTNTQNKNYVVRKNKKKFGKDWLGW